MADGNITWFEINVPDVGRAQQFYGAVFPWEFAPMPDYPTYVIVSAAGAQVGALQGSEDPDPSGRGVTVYGQVADLEASLESARSGGGTVTQERMEVPGGQWIALIRDPFGLQIGLVTNNPAS